MARRPPRPAAGAAAPAVALPRSWRARQERALARRGHHARRHGQERRARRGRRRAAAGGARRRRRRARVRAPRDRRRLSARWSAQSGAIVAAIVIGDRAGLDDDVQRRLQEAGTYHVIAISGGNIAILAGPAARRVPPRRLARPDRDAVARSPCSSGVRGARRRRRVGRSRHADGGRLLRRARASISAARRSTRLRSSAALLVAADPLSVADPAFLLTFGATLAILVVVPALGDR